MIRVTGRRAAGYLNPKVRKNELHISVDTAGLVRDVLIVRFLLARRLAVFAS